VRETDVQQKGKWFGAQTHTKNVNIDVYYA
jgi:hypothetical protein